MKTTHRDTQHRIPKHTARCKVLTMMRQSCRPLHAAVTLTAIITVYTTVCVGRTTAEALVDEDGAVVDVSIVVTDPLLHSAALLLQRYVHGEALHGLYTTTCVDMC